MIVGMLAKKYAYYVILENHASLQHKQNNCILLIIIGYYCMKYGYDCWVVRTRKNTRQPFEKHWNVIPMMARIETEIQGLFVCSNDGDRLPLEIIHLANMYKVLTLLITYYYCMCEGHLTTSTTYQLNASQAIAHQAHNLRMIKCRHERTTACL